MTKMREKIYINERKRQISNWLKIFWIYTASTYCWNLQTTSDWQYFYRNTLIGAKWWITDIIHRYNLRFKISNLTIILINFFYAPLDRYQTQSQSVTKKRPKYNSQAMFRLVYADLFEFIYWHKYLSAFLVELMKTVYN